MKIHSLQEGNYAKSLLTVDDPVKQKLTWIVRRAVNGIPDKKSLNLICNNVRNFWLDQIRHVRLSCYILGGIVIGGVHCGNVLV